MLQTLHAMLDRRQPQCPVFGLNLGTVGFLMNEWRADGLEARLAHAKAVNVTPLCMEATTLDGEQPSLPAPHELHPLRETRQPATTEVHLTGRTVLPPLDTKTGAWRKNVARRCSNGGG